MTAALICISIELKKFFRSKVPMLTLLAISLIPFMGGFFYVYSQRP